MLKKFILAAAVLFGLQSLNAQILYKVEGNGLERPSYIFGTHHLAPLATVDSVEGTRQAFDMTDRVVGEIDMSKPQMEIAMAMQPYMIAPADSLLSSLVDPGKFETLDNEFSKWAPMKGMSLASLSGFKPMVVTAMVALGMVKQEMPDFREGEQLDTYFQTLGKENGKPIVPLETVEQQASILYCSTPIRIQMESLVDILENPEKALKISADMNDAYRRQDLVALSSIADSEDNHEFSKRILDDRNADWLTKLPAIMKEAPSFIAVGALHLPGEKGILKGLRELGFTVTPVK